MAAGGGKISRRLYLILILALALLGAFLLALDLGGLFLSLRNPGLAASHDLFFFNDITLGWPEAQRQIEATQKSFPDATTRAVRLNQIVNQTMAHYWPVSSGKYHLRVPPWDNYLLWLLSRLDPKAFYPYEFANPMNALERGVGLCSQQALALAGLLSEAGIEPTIAVLGGHVVVEIEEDGRKMTLDPDFGLVIPAGVGELGRDPARALPYYTEAQKRCRMPEKCDPNYMAGLYGPAGNHLVKLGAVGYLGPERVEFERFSYLIIWVIPLLLLAPLGVRLVAARLAARPPA